MSKPTKAMMLHAREDVIKAVNLVRPRIDLSNPEVEQAWAQLETFVAIALRVMAKTNVSKLQSETRTVEISAGLAGRTIFLPD